MPSSDVPEPGAPGRPGRGRRWRLQFRLLAALILAGVVLAFVWRALTPHAAGLGDEQEAAASVDGTLALLGLGFGVVTGVFVLIRPGSSPILRTVAAIVGSVLGGVVSWLLGDQLGTPALRAVGAAFTWPVATSIVIFLGALLPMTSARLETSPDRTPPPSP